MFAASKTATPAGGGTDPQFNYVTMLLHGDGTNGGQNNTFLDSSTNNFTITRNGNTTQGSFSPYGTLWSNYFVSNYINTASSIGSFAGSFTIECWVYANANGPIPWCLGDCSLSSGLDIQLFTNKISVITAGAGTDLTTSAWTRSTWNHIAVVRNAGVITVYVNGSSVGTVSNSSTFSGVFYVAAQLFSGSAANGGTQYISNLRVTNTAVYTGAFTPSTTPLTAVSGTQLLTCQSNRFIDNSTNNYGITIVGSDNSVQRFSPFAPSAAYSTATIGGSGYFDGSGDYLSVPASSSWVTGSSGSVTIEFWANADANNYYYLMDQGAGNEAAIAIGFGVSTGYIYWYNGNASVFLADIGSLTIPAGTWNHFAFVINAGVPKVYLNGVLQSGTYTNNAFGVNATLSIGRYSGGTSYNFKGYISNFRFVSGQAIYTANFTPPTAPLTAVTNTQLLLSMTNGAIFDNAMMNDLETVGNAQISTSVVKYGTGSMYFDGGGDFLTIPYSPQFDLGSGNFTIECWVYAQAEGGKYFINLNGNDSNYAQVAMAIYGTAKIEVDISISSNSWAIAYSSPNNSCPLNQWNHVALVRNGSSFTLYINGTGYSVGTSSSALYNYAGRTLIGSGTTSSYNYQGYIDDLRITKGYARYTANFTPPTQAFPNN